MRVTDEGRRLIQLSSQEKGVSQAAIGELAVRDDGTKRD